jgi:hypothetical protein
MAETSASISWAAGVWVLSDWIKKSSPPSSPWNKPETSLPASWVAASSTMASSTGFSSVVSSSAAAGF